MEQSNKSSSLSLKSKRSQSDLRQKDEKSLNQDSFPLVGSIDQNNSSQENNIHLKNKQIQSKNQKSSDLICSPATQQRMALSALRILSQNEEEDTSFHPNNNNNHQHQINQKQQMNSNNMNNNNYNNQFGQQKQSNTSNNLNMMNQADTRDISGWNLDLEIDEDPGLNYFLQDRSKNNLLKSFKKKPIHSLDQRHESLHNPINNQNNNLHGITTTTPTPINITQDNQNYNYQRQGALTKNTPINNCSSNIDQVNSFNNNYMGFKPRSNTDRSIIPGADLMNRNQYQIGRNSPYSVTDQYGQNENIQYSSLNKELKSLLTMLESPPCKQETRAKKSDLAGQDNQYRLKLYPIHDDSGANTQSNSNLLCNVRSWNNEDSVAQNNNGINMNYGNEDSRNLISQIIQKRNAVRVIDTQQSLILQNDNDAMHCNLHGRFPRKQFDVSEANSKLGMGMFSGVEHDNMLETFTQRPFQRQNLGSQNSPSVENSTLRTIQNFNILANRNSASIQDSQSQNQASSNYDIQGLNALYEKYKQVQSHPGIQNILNRVNVNKRNVLNTSRNPTPQNSATPTSSAICYIKTENTAYLQNSIESNSNQNSSNIVNNNNRRNTPQIGRIYSIHHPTIIPNKNLPSVSTSLNNNNLSINNNNPLVNYESQIQDSSFLPTRSNSRQYSCEGTQSNEITNINHRRLLTQSGRQQLDILKPATLNCNNSANNQTFNTSLEGAIQKLLVNGSYAKNVVYNNSQKNEYSLPVVEQRRYNSGGNQNSTIIKKPPAGINYKAMIQNKIFNKTKRNFEELYNNQNKQNNLSLQVTQKLINNEVNQEWLQGKQVTHTIIRKIVKQKINEGIQNEENNETIDKENLNPSI